MTSIHTRAFTILAAILAAPSVSVLFLYATNPDIVATGYGTGIIFTWSAVACVAMLAVTFISGLCDILNA